VIIELPPNLDGVRLKARVVTGACMPAAIQRKIDHSKHPLALEVEDRWSQSGYKNVLAQYSGETEAERKKKAAGQYEPDLEFLDNIPANDSFGDTNVITLNGRPIE
jgi:hypothetical protein